MIDIRSFRDLLRLFFIFRREFEAAVVVTLVLVLLGAFLLPTKYESNARLLVKPGRESTTLPLEVANRQALIAPSTQRDPIVDEEKMLTGRPIVRMVAERYIELMANYQPQGVWKTIKFEVGKAVNAVIDALRSVLQLLGLVEAQSPVERLAKKLEKNFTVGHEPGSAVMEISFTWNDPAIAQKVVQTWVDVYLAERARTLGRKSLQVFYENEMQQVAAQIDGLKNDLRTRLQEVNAVSVQERLENLTNQINRLADARAESLNEQAGIASFLADARLQLKRQPQEVVTAREVSLNPNQLDLKRRLNALEEQRAGLLRTFLPDTPPVREVDQSIEQMKAMIAKEAERIERSKNFAPNAIVANLQQQIIDAELRAKQLAGQVKDYDAQLAQLQQERLRVMADEPAITRLLLELANAEKSYALYAETLEKARIDQALDNSQISNIAKIEEATFNPSRVFPKSLMMLLLALPAALAVGLLTLYLCYLIDQRIHDGARIETVFKVPLWSTLQDLGPQPWKLDSAFTASLYRLYSHLPLDRVQQQGLTLALASARPGEGVRFVTEHLARLLIEHGYQVRLLGSEPARPGEVLILNASSLLSNQDAFLALRRADLIALVVEAKTSTIPVVQNALSLLQTGFGKVDGIILNKRRFEVPGAVLDLFRRLRGGA
ncbi:lipopolysaccharide biosynthesis protein [Pseudomonas sp. GOM7]|uniref:exopolysaccharide transport family protein n=1 Tax=Pseudomonas sp. GOM7 TaxID=2998079 RepID=UPI00227BF0FB|nr:lipopolysaccharide biosynthesis protein [Pseudomonas sp. GOM7]WAJ37311.1 lipopolysaccharide biosynthesis protein [Pseudomonas sp. GOM7]